MRQIISAHGACTIIEKDYYLTEALRIIEQAAGEKVIFKGGTSLSKCHRATSSTRDTPTGSGIWIWIRASGFSTRLSKSANTASRESSTRGWIWNRSLGQGGRA